MWPAQVMGCFLELTQPGTAAAPQHPWGRCRKPPHQPANPDAPPRSSVSSSVRWGVCFTKAAPITGGRSPGCLPCLFLLVLRRLRRLSQHRLFGFHRGLTARVGLREAPSALTPPTKGGRRARLWVHLSKECLPPVPLSSAGQARGERVHSGRPLRLQTCFDALGAKGAPK